MDRELIHIHEFARQSGIAHAEVLKRAARGSYEIRIVNNYKYIVSTWDTRRLMTMNKNSRSKLFKRLMKNGIIYYGTMGRICQKDKIPGRW